MSKVQFLKALDVARQTLPFIMITAIFIGLAYTYGHALSPFQIDPSSDLVRLSCHFAP
ncbi:MAG: hypothetical protein ACD_16C00110G0013 [uncultured bacterium]|nr:MAG: hypothetical protein ACD_16C00110G0013 [uncultured bacterium]